MADFVLPYSRRDFGQILAEYKQQLPEVSEGAWTDFTEPDVGYTLLKGAVALFDFNAFYTDAMGAECLLSTCTERESGVRIGKALGYDPDLTTPATVSVQVNSPAFNEPVVLPANHTWTIQNLPYTCLSQVTIPIGQTATVINLVQGSPYTKTHTVTSSTAFLKLAVPRNIAELVVKVNGEAWEPIDSFSEGVTTKKSYRRYEDPISGQIIMFGAGVTTYQPKVGDVIEITGVTTLGAIANNPQAPLIASLTSVIRNSADANITSSLSGMTITAIAGGKDIESLDSIKKHAPALYATQGRAVTRKDIESFVLAFPGVKDCYVQGVREGAPRGYFIVTAYGNTPSDATPEFLQSIKEYIETLNLLCILVIMKAPLVIKIATTVEVGAITNAQFVSQGTLINQVNQTITDYFDAMRISDSVLTSELTSKIQALSTVKYSNVSYKVSTESELSGTGYLVIPVLENADLTNAMLVDEDEVVILSGDLSAKVQAGSFIHRDQSLDAQKTYTLSYVPKSSAGGTNVLVPKRAVCMNTQNDISIVYVND